MSLEFQYLVLLGQKDRLVNLVVLVKEDHLACLDALEILVDRAIPVVQVLKGLLESQDFVVRMVYLGHLVSLDFQA